MGNCASGCTDLGAESQAFEELRVVICLFGVRCLMMEPSREGPFPFLSFFFLAFWMTVVMAAFLPSAVEEVEKALGEVSECLSTGVVGAAGGGVSVPLLGLFSVAAAVFFVIGIIFLVYF